MNPSDQPQPTSGNVRAGRPLPAEEWLRLVLQNITDYAIFTIDPQGFVTDWPEGARRNITISLGPVVGLAAPVLAPLECMLDRLREGDAMAYDYEGD